MAISSTDHLSQTEQLLDALKREKLIGIVRTPDAEQAIWASSCLIDAGFKFIEIPCTVPDTARVIERLCQHHQQAVIGAGTVLEARQALQSLGAGAKFLVSPVLEEKMVQFGAEQDILVLPGTMTPTEIYQATGYGAKAIKFFPAEAAGGAGFIKALRGPFPDVQIVATGGIHLEHMLPYWQAGALAVGVGAPLIPKEILQRQDYDALYHLAKSYLAQREAFQAL